MSQYYIKVKSCESAPNVEPEYWSQQTVSASQKNLFYNLGNVGIGIPNPLGKLQVDGSVGIGAAFATTAPPSNGLIVSGNVGIGINAPAHKLHVVGNTRIEGDLIVNGTQTIVNTVAGTTERLEVTNDGTGPALRVTQQGAQPIADFCDDLSTNVVVRIADGGNVGIGTMDPQAKLHVVGYALHSNPYYSATRIAYSSATNFRVGIIEYSDTTNRVTNVASWYISASGNGYFEPKLAGKYFVCATDIAGTGSGTLQIRVNSTVYHPSHWNMDDSWANVTAQAIVPCNGTTDKIYVVCDGVGVWLGGAHGKISIYYLGP